MAIVKDTILVATATLCVGSAFMEIPSESKSFNKYFPYIGTFLSAGIGYYFLRRSNAIKAAEYQPSQEMDDYSLNEIAKSSAIEGFEPMKFSVVGNRAEGLETIFDAEGAFGEKPSINFSWKSYDDNLKETEDKLLLFDEMKANKILVVDALYAIKDQININFPLQYPNGNMNLTNVDLRGYFDFNGGRFYLIKYDFYALKMKTKKGQPNFKIEPAYLVYYGKTDSFGDYKLNLIAGASSKRTTGELLTVAPTFNKRPSFQKQYENTLRKNNIRHLAFNEGRKEVTSHAKRYLYFNCMTPQLALNFDEELDVASDERAIEKFQNMIIPYSYKVKASYPSESKATTKTITNYYYVDDLGGCKFFIAIHIDELTGTLKFLGDTKSHQGVSKKDDDVHRGIAKELEDLFEYRPLLKLWLKSVVMDSSNLSKRRINMWNNDRSKWFKQQYTPMLFQKWMPVLYTNHRSKIACDYIKFMKACLSDSQELAEDSPLTTASLKEDPNTMDDSVALELFKKYYKGIIQWEDLAASWNSPNESFEHPQFYNSIMSNLPNRLQKGIGEHYFSMQGSNKYSIINTESSKNTIVPVASWFNSKMPSVLPLEINNTKDLKVRAFRKLYNKYALDSLGFWIDEESAEENSYYTNEEEPQTMNDYISYSKFINFEKDVDNFMKQLDNLLLDNHPDFRPYKEYEGGEYEAETFESESNKKPHSVIISRSSNSQKKLMAVFEDSEGKKIKTTHFGQRGASDYTKHGDKERMERYLERHGGGTTTSTKEDWKDPTTAGALSRWILWNKPSLSASFSDYKSRFGLKGTLNVSKSAETFEATEWVGFCPECNKWRTKEMSVKIDSKVGIGWSIPDELVGKRLCRKSQRFGKITNHSSSWSGYGQRTHEDSYCGTPLTKVKSKYKAEERKCCECGATKGITTIQTGTFCFSCLPINLGVETFEAKSPAQKSLDDWNDEDWKTKSGKPSGETGERFLPTKAIESLTDKEYKETSDKKRKDSKKGKQFSDQPKDIAEKTAKYRAEPYDDGKGLGVYSKYGINDPFPNKAETPMIMIDSEHDHDGDYDVDFAIYSDFAGLLGPYVIWFKHKVANGWKGLEFFDIKLIPLTENSYSIVILMKGKSIYQNKMWKIATDYDYPIEILPYRTSWNNASSGYDFDADVYYVKLSRFYVSPDTLQAKHYKKIWDAYKQSNTETFEAIEGTGSKARFTDTPDSKVYRDTSLRQKARNTILKGTKGGNAGQWSAIKANLSASKYRSLYENKYGEGKNPYF